MRLTRFAEGVHTTCVQSLTTLLGGLAALRRHFAGAARVHVNDGCVEELLHARVLIRTQSASCESSCENASHLID